MVRGAGRGIYFHNDSVQQQTAKALSAYRLTSASLPFAAAASGRHLNANPL
jgi:hypothetical protein